MPLGAGFDAHSSILLPICSLCSVLVVEDVFSHPPAPAATLPRRIAFGHGIFVTATIR